MEPPQPLAEDRPEAAPARETLIAPRRRRPLVPKELIWPVIQRLFLVLFVMCFTALAIRLHTMYRMGKFSHPGSQFSPLMVNGSHFFVDIGSGNSGLEGFSHTKKLEENGWKGVCVDPFLEKGRACTPLAMPVTPMRGQSAQVSDCTSPDPETSDKCRKVSRNGVAVFDVLKLAKAPPIIDYLNLDTEGTELDVLKTFPFKDFCVRSWTVQHRNESALQAGAQEVLESRGCKVTDTGVSHWARCPCSEKGESLIAEDTPTHEGTKAAHNANLGNSKVQEGPHIMRKERLDRKKHKANTLELGSTGE